MFDKPERKITSITQHIKGVPANRPDGNEYASREAEKVDLSKQKGADNTDGSAFTLPEPLNITALVPDLVSLSTRKLVRFTLRIRMAITTRDQRWRDLIEQQYEPLIRDLQERIRLLVEDRTKKDAQRITDQVDNQIIQDLTIMFTRQLASVLSEAPRVESKDVEYHASNGTARRVATMTIPGSELTLTIEPGRQRVTPSFIGWPADRTLRIVHGVIHPEDFIDFASRFFLRLNPGAIEMFPANAKRPFLPHPPVTREEQLDWYDRHLGDNRRHF
jgi:hypothetical protein